jgi:hypothetical protein
MLSPDMNDGQKLTACAVRTERRPNPLAGPILDRNGKLSNQVDIRLITVLIFSTALATTRPGRLVIVGPGGARPAEKPAPSVRGESALPGVHVAGPLHRFQFLAHFQCIPGVDHHRDLFSSLG